MSDVFFRDLGLREPDVHLGIGSGTHAQQTGQTMIAFERLCLEDRPDLVLVVGDVNATVACSLVAAKLQIPVAHVEAGLRSGDRRMPEEINRIVTDQLSDLLFTTSRDADENLVREGIAAEKIHFTGNVMVDSLLQHLESVDANAVVQRLLGKDQKDSPFGLLTLHRPSNVDKKEVLEGWLGALESIAEHLNMICPLHPRTEKRLESFGLKGRFESAVRALPPLGYLDFIALLQKASIVITDSGGLQEETTVIGVPCLTIRENTERPVTIEQGSNRLVGLEPTRLKALAVETLAAPPAPSRRPERWDGGAAARIVDVLERCITA
jgi:UDP-N-acetylglucosamine 2-epimerase (non-hydrolysing)